MVLSAIDAGSLTSNSTQVHQQQTLVEEVRMAERSIRNAATRELSKIRYNSINIGNPPLDDLTGLTELQQSFYDTFISAGYVVGRDADTGFWLIRWEATGPEALVSVYSLRTTVTPGSNANLVIASLKQYFAELEPTVTARAFLVNPTGSGGDVPESAFGASNSVFYEYIVVVTQGDTIDHATALRSFMITTPYGFINSPSNIMVYKLG